jgi:hypothetical protein
VNRQAIAVAREALRAALALLESLDRERVAEPEEWFTSATYPHGARAFRRHVKAGMPAVRVGKGYRVRRTDAERYWTTLQRKPRARAGDDAEAVLRAAGFRA